VKSWAKSIAVIIFLLLGSAPLLLSLFVTLQKNTIRHRIKEKLEKRDLWTVAIPEYEVRWMDRHEIWVNNSMFDIKTKKLENGIYTFTGLYDEEETLLVEKERNAAGKNNEQNKLLARMFSSLPLFFERENEIIYYSSLNNLYTVFIPSHPISPFKKILTPPPKC